MARIRIFVVLVVALAAVAVTTSAASASPDSYMLRKVNHFRHRHGLRSIRWSHSLHRSARKYARYQMRHQYFGHARRIHASSRYRRLGEILEIQRGYRPHVKLAFRTWIHSSPHRAIILDRHFNFAAAGRAKGRFQGRRDTIWVMHFGRP